MNDQRMLSILLLSCFLFLILSPGIMGTVEQYATSLTDPRQKKMSERKWRKMMIQTNDDYHDPGPNQPGAYRDPRSNNPYYAPLATP
ncbi:hypothetical protein IC582_020704 [Cucumis melo]|uniref:Uncharacterized protein n=1 Tax=Cucumis melo TaxID=3656 RepID=A0A9I9EHT7_CUCME